MKDSVQIRIRLPKAKASPWLDIPPVLRSKVVGMVLGAVGTINLAELASMRRELVNLGTLLNQSLCVSRGRSVDDAALKQCVALLSRITK
jgi:hypothetical protein